VVYIIVAVLDVAAIILTLGFLFTNVYYRGER